MYTHTHIHARKQTQAAVSSNYQPTKTAFQIQVRTSTLSHIWPREHTRMLTHSLSHIHTHINTHTHTHTISLSISLRPITQTHIPSFSFTLSVQVSLLSVLSPPDPLPSPPSTPIVCVLHGKRIQPAAHYITHTFSLSSLPFFYHKLTFSHTKLKQLRHARTFSHFSFSVFKRSLSCRRSTPKMHTVSSCLHHKHKHCLSSRPCSPEIHRGFMITSLFILCLLTLIEFQSHHMVDTHCQQFHTSHTHTVSRPSLCLLTLTEFQCILQLLASHAHTLSRLSLCLLKLRHTTLCLLTFMEFQS